MCDKQNEGKVMTMGFYYLVKSENIFSVDYLFFLRFQIILVVYETIAVLHKKLDQFHG